MPGLFDAQGGPGFSMMGYLLGGKGYASSWFSQRDAQQRVLALEAQHQAERGAGAKTLLASPEFAAALANPQDPRAQYGLWALAQGLPEPIANSQGSYLGTALSDIGQRKDAEFRVQAQIAAEKRQVAQQIAQEQRQQALVLSEEQRRGGAAQELIGSPEMKAAIANPLDRNAQNALWAKSQGMPTPVAQQGNTNLTQSVNDIAQRADADYRATLAEQQLKLSGDQQLMLDQIKRDRDNAAAKNAQALLFSPQAKQQQMAEETRNMIFDQATKDTGMKRPEDMSVVINGDQISFVPRTGGKTWQEMMAKIGPSQGVITNLNTALEKIKEGTMNAGTYDAIRFDTLNLVRAAAKTGAMDEGSVRQLDQIMPEHGWTGVGTETTRRVEAFRTYVELQKAEIARTAQTYAMPVERIPAAPNFRPNPSLKAQLDQSGETHPNDQKKAAEGGPAPSKEFGTEFERGAKVPEFKTRKPSALETFREERRVKRQMEGLF